MKNFTHGFRTIDVLRGAVLPCAAALFLSCAVSLHAQEGERASLHRIPPIYPPLAKQMHIGGVIKVTATVDASGSVVKAESDSPNKMLVPAAIDAVKHWKFSPGDSVTVVTVKINFEPGM